MTIGIIDADLISNSEHNFPNLACMKISGYHKSNGHDTRLINYNEISSDSLFRKNYDLIYISKVFTKSIVPSEILKLPNVIYGGTGFFYDKAEPLDDEIEHSFPDYHLYDSWIDEKIRRGWDRKYFVYYTDYSIGFTTRGCFRKCEFCVNKNYNSVILHSPISEFYDSSRKKICLLDDNLFGCGNHWEKILLQLKAINKPFQYKQGLDIRIMSEKKAKMLSGMKYDGDYIFAFDDIKDSELIERKLSIFRNNIPNKHLKLYLFCAYDRSGIYNHEFWIKDISDLFERIRILMKYKAVPYVMKYEKFVESRHTELYRLISMWGTPLVFKKKSFREYVIAENKAGVMLKFEREHPQIAARYFDIKFENKTY